MNQISPLAFVHPEAKLGDNNVIGPFCYIDKNTVLGDNNVMQNSVTINYGARIGNNNEFFVSPPLVILMVIFAPSDAAAAVNVIVFLVLSFLGMTEDGEFMLKHGAMYVPYLIQRGEYYRLFSSMFLHFGYDHLVNNMIVLVAMGYGASS